MTVVNISWNLCVLFAVALIASSAITVAPGGQAWMRLEMGMWLALTAIKSQSAPRPMNDAGTPLDTSAANTSSPCSGENSNNTRLVGFSSFLGSGQ
jgi:hypothetical protein